VRVNILIVDDHPELLDLVSRALERDDHVVRAVGTLSEARLALGERTPDVLVLDLALPDGEGVDLCRELRRAGEQLPILMLTAHGEVRQRVAGLDAGADDFLAKPFAMAELRARVRALGRRGAVTRSTVAHVGDVELDFGAQRALRGSEEVPFTPREWSILALLSSRAGRVVSRTDILESVWGETSDANSESLDVIMARIRRKLGSAQLRTIRGMGYALDRDVG
jgi:two-component system OmpR family response regulator